MRSCGCSTSPGKRACCMERRPRTRMRVTLALVSAVALGLIVGGSAAERQRGAGVPTWPQWRGPNQDGHSADPRVPLRWGPGDNLKWQTDLPGFGNSSPVVWGERVFLTAATRTGTERWVLCLDRKT